MEKWYEVLKQALADPLPDKEIIHDDIIEYVERDMVDYVRRTRYQVKVMCDGCIESEYETDTLKNAKKLSRKLAKQIDYSDYSDYCVEVEDSLINSGIAHDIVFKIP